MPCNDTEKLRKIGLEYLGNQWNKKPKHLRTVNLSQQSQSELSQSACAHCNFVSIQICTKYVHIYMSFMQEIWSHQTKVLQEMEFNSKAFRYNFFHALTCQATMN